MNSLTIMYILLYANIIPLTLFLLRFGTHHKWYRSWTGRGIFAFAGIIEAILLKGTLNRAFATSTNTGLNETLNTIGIVLYFLFNVIMWATFIMLIRAESKDTKLKRELKSIMDQADKETANK